MIKFDKLMCPHVGCYVVAKCNSESPGSVGEARAAIQLHRHQKHNGAKSLLDNARHPKWMHEAD